MWNKWKARLRNYFRLAPVLVITLALMGVDLLICIIGLLVDHTRITGMPAWDKPFKFAVSGGIYALSLLLIIHWTPVWKKLLRFAEFLVGVSLTMELALIDMQAYRHTTSHFNVATPFDASVYAAMGTGVSILWGSTVVLAAASFFHRYRTPALTVAIRAGLVLLAVGAGTGALMARPTHAQLAAEHVTGQMTIAGAHTVGAADGGKGLPFLGWSTQHGDIRVAHFIGLHALQVLIVLAFLLYLTRLSYRQAARITLAASLSYGALIALTLSEALLGKPVTDHSAPALASWLAWLALSAGALVLAADPKPARPQHALPEIRRSYDTRTGI